MSTPSDTQALVAIDLGAESCRVSLLRWIESKPVLTLVHRFPNSPRETSQGLRWDLEAIEQGVYEGLVRAAQQAPEGIRSIAVDGWAVDYVRLDAHGKAIADPYCYRDERTLASERALHAVISAQRMREITGVGILRSISPSTSCIVSGHGQSRSSATRPTRRSSISRPAPGPRRSQPPPGSTSPSTLKLSCQAHWSVVSPVL
jgi:hypothetical protein